MAWTKVVYRNLSRIYTWQRSSDHARALLFSSTVFSREMMRVHYRSFTV